VQHQVQGRGEILKSDWFQNIDGQFDLIVSNPPYISLQEMADLSPEVRVHEPRMALTDEGDGLGAYRRIAAGAPDFLLPGGRLLVEIGPTQGQSVAALFESAGLTATRIVPDLDGRDRVVFAKMPL
jgi:release factor glutamine methyltransferase